MVVGHWYSGDCEMTRVRCCVFDFDGTISLLRGCWRSVMYRYMVGCGVDGRDVERYIVESAGMATLDQMGWLVGVVGGDARVHRDMYVELMREEVHELLVGGGGDVGRWLVPGVVRLLDGMVGGGIEMWVASGTEHVDLLNEVKLLGLAHYFDGIEGARDGSCVKDDVVSGVLDRYDCGEVVVIGDGVIEMGVSRRYGCLGIGLVDGGGDALRLLGAGANVLVKDFEDGKVRRWLLGLTD